MMYMIKNKEIILKNKKIFKLSKMKSCIILTFFLYPEF